MTDATTVRYRNTVLYDHGGEKVTGDILLHHDGTWSASNGDEDVVDDIDGSQRLITRSFQNWHTHLAMQLNARDFSDGFPLHRWLNEAIFPTEARITPDYVRMGSRCAAAEMIRTGSTFAADMYFFPSVTGEVLTEAGIRGLIGGPVSDSALPSHDDAASALSELDGLLATNNESDLVQYAIATHSVYLCTEDTLRRASELAEKRQSRLHIHVSETRKEIADCHESTGKYPIEYLDSIDFFQPGTVCAHASWVKKNEIRLLKQHEATAVHCPSSNMKLACGGTLSLPAYMEAGVDVRLGTDGAASSGNGLNMQAEARLASLVQRHDHWDPTILPAVGAMGLATKGSKDWAVWDLNDVRMRPRGRTDNRHLANLIFNGAECLDLWVNGQAVRKDGTTLTLDELSILDEIDGAVATYYEGVE
ncbi:amidohydrolase family protein [Candidatus Poseidonia alphae]|nr:amidohydrolase family protein [Candidatus Poseidonia alphae]MDA8749693.1 amidohydrolase family protein [Candidatus Poseidonia alphae]MDA8759203.1 amidohydrolase family protein [Candidatus Poseidonia alphae]MDA8839330.1 amidohydrolase family protein [Candidatus Poseidonia alphae]MDB2569003.1 amidohydrolase family protein [Candidatus Poseidonia alphae]